MSVTTHLKSLKINYLTQEQYDEALSNEEINENELYLTQSEDEIVYRDFTCESFTFNSGAAGNYAGEKHYDASLYGYDILGSSIIYAGHAANYNVVLYIYNNYLYFTFYRTSSSAYTLPVNDVKARVIYKKINPTV